MIALIDGDIVAYEVAFRCDGGSEEMVELEIEESLWKIMNDARCNTSKVYLTGSTNFRKDVAVTAPYKGNRKGEKPFWLAKARSYMLEQGAILREGLEADDLIGIESQKMVGKCVICSIDKDLTMLEGHHYNWRKGVNQKINLEQGINFFLKQLLTGDTVDNIRGLERVGDKTADKILELELTAMDMWAAVVSEYKSRLGDGWLEYLTEMGKLLWIHRSEVDEWTPYWFEEWLTEVI